MDYLKKVIEEKENDRKEIFYEKCQEEKKYNYTLFKLGIKKCLCCNHESKKENLTHGTWNLFSMCTKCKSKCWLVGNGFSCEICKKIIIRPEVHHIDGNRKNNSFENLIYICIKCHKKIHRPSTKEGKIRRNRGKIIEDIDITNKIKELQNQLIKK